MKFKDIFDREVIVEEHVRKGLKIFYEIDMNLIKPKQEETTPENKDKETNMSDFAYLKYQNNDTPT